MTQTRRFSLGFEPAEVADVLEPSGVRAILEECAVQHRDVMTTLASPSHEARSVADMIARTGRVTLLGMGGSHHANQIAAARFRVRGIQALALPASEAVYAAPPLIEPPVIVVSQSGASAEILKWLDSRDATDGVFGITLNETSALASRVTTMIAAGGNEKAFAATRSFTLTLALYAKIMNLIEHRPDDEPAADEPPMHPNLDRAIAVLSSATSFIVSGRASFEGIARMAALGLLELCRMPALAFEGGQLRHGPVEMLKSNTGVIIFRAAGSSAQAWESIASFCVDAKAPLVVFDTSGEPPLEGALTLRFNAGDGIRALYDMAPTEQALIIALASLYAERPGQPIYCGKVTASE